jgi:uncharacterized protein YdaU (DUF1376 family)
VNYYKHYMGDYQRDTGHLSLSQDGAYRRMMDHYYSTEQPLPADKEALYRICGAMDAKERKAADFVAATFFVKNGNQLHHQRIDEEIAKAQEKIANLKVNGASGGVKSGASRSSKSEANAKANAKANASPKDEAKTNNTNTNNQTKPNGLETLRLPAWLDAPLWGEWVAYRTSIRAKLTLRAAELCIAKLEQLRSDGDDPRAVIEQSIMSGKWTGLFPLRAAQARASAYISKEDKRKTFIDELTGANRGTGQPIIDIN